MPQNFANGKIYSIRSHQTDKIYIGSTTQPLHKRFHQHKLSNKTTSREILLFDDAYIELVENYPCTDKNELYRREGEIIRTTVCVNKQIAGRTDAEYQKQYREDNKEDIAKRDRLYYEDNKESIKQRKQQYYKDNKEQAKQYYKDNKESIKQRKQRINTKETI